VKSILNEVDMNRSRSLYIGLMELVWIVAGGVGPVLGGAFTEKLSWRCKSFYKSPGHSIAVLTTQQGTSGSISLSRVPHLSFCLYIWTFIILKLHCSMVSKQ
jgi:MFS family permease